MEDLGQVPKFCVHVTRSPNKTTTEPVTNADTQGFIDYKLKLGLAFRTPAWRVEENDPEFLGLRIILKEKTISKVVHALAFLDWVKIG